MLTFIRLCMIIVLVSATSSAEKKIYALTTEPIDVVIPVAEKKDVETLEACIDGIKQYGAGVREVYVISSKQYTNKAYWIDEQIFPFTKLDIAHELFGSLDQAHFYLKQPKNRIGWIYQQLLKLYAPFVIPGISSNVLLLDADTIFLNPVSFLTEKGEPLFNIGCEYWKPYSRHGKRLLPTWKRMFPAFSGITHHMLIQKEVLIDLFNRIENLHETQCWMVLIQCINIEHVFKHPGSCLSEYEIYFNFMVDATDQAHIRELKWKNSPHLHDLDEFKKEGYHYVSCHAHMRQNK